MDALNCGTFLMAIACVISCVLLIMLIKGFLRDDRAENIKKLSIMGIFFVLSSYFGYMNFKFLENFGEDSVVNENTMEHDLSYRKTVYTTMSEVMKKMGYNHKNIHLIHDKKNGHITSLNPQDVIVNVKEIKKDDGKILAELTIVHGPDDKYKSYSQFAGEKLLSQMVDHSYDFEKDYALISEYDYMAIRMDIGFTNQTLAKSDTTSVTKEDEKKDMNTLNKMTKEK